jgi:hypothetical protein
LEKGQAFELDPGNQPWVTVKAIPVEETAAKRECAMGLQWVPGRSR